MNNESLVSALSEKLGLGPLALENGMGAIQFDDHVMNFQVDANHDELRCFLRVMDIPASPESQLALYRQMLSANTFGLATGGGHLGIDETERFVIFSRAVSAGGLSLDRLEIILEIMLNMVEGFQRDWAEAAAAAQSQPAAAPLHPVGLRV